MQYVKHTYEYKCVYEEYNTLITIPTFPYKVVGVTSSEWTDRFHDPHVQENYLETTFI